MNNWNRLKNFVCNNCQKISRKTLVIGGLIFCLAFSLGFLRAKSVYQVDPMLAPVSLENAKPTEKEKTTEVSFAQFWRVWDLLKEKYVDADKLDARQLMYGAIKGMLAATGDPYTNFFNPEETKEFGEDIKGSFEGIGAELGIKNQILTIVAPLEGTPAEKAGLRAGDKIIKIDGKSTVDLDLDQAVKLIRGQRGTEVALTIFREGEQDSREVKVRRDVINVKSVKWEMKEGQVAYLKVSRFGDDTEKSFATALQTAVKQKPQAIILDLRNNPGGYLDAAVMLSSKMLPKGKTVVIEEDAAKKQNNGYALGGDISSGIFTVVLINEGSASAAEIMAGALKENRDNVVLVGEKSFGKGSVQEYIELKDKTAVKITVERWLTPQGHQINEQGINPDVEIKLTNEDYQNDRDPQLDKALEIAKAGKVN